MGCVGPDEGIMVCGVLTAEACFRGHLDQLGIGRSAGRVLQHVPAKDLQKKGFASRQVWYWTIAEDPSKYWKYIEVLVPDRPH